MLKRFFPNQYLDSVFDIDYYKLYERNIRGLIFDIDNTLVPFDVIHPTKEIKDLFEKLIKMGFKICLLSNNSKKRVLLFNEKLNMPFVFRAKKPTLIGINKALSLIKTDEKNTVLIGDQVFTDVWCANRKGIYVILLKPIALKDEFSVKLKRGIEKLVIKYYEKSRRTKK